jgi:hypothetical protein
MTERFLRDYELVIGIGAQAVTIKPPFRIVFSADKSDDATLNKLTLKIDGLNEAKRRLLVRDSEQDTYFPLDLKIGYQGRIETIFRGSIDKAGSTRDGAQFVTTIECLDGGNDFLKGFVSATVTSKAAVIDAVLGTMPNTQKGRVGAMGDLIRPKVLVGNSVAVVQEMLDPGQRWFIDDERLNVLGGNEIVSSFAPLISAETGLLNTPEADKKNITITSFLNPAVKVGGIFKLESKTAPHLNGIYKVSTITYSGDYEGADWTMRVSGVIAANYSVPR